MQEAMCRCGAPLHYLQEVAKFLGVLHWSLLWFSIGFSFVPWLLRELLKWFLRSKFVNIIVYCLMVAYSFNCSQATCTAG